MEKYREKLKIDNLIISIAAFILTIFCVLAAAAEAGLLPFPVPTAGNSHWQSMWRGFICGASFGILALMVAFLIRNFLALKDEKRLKKLYIKETDERSIKIWASARESAYRTFLLLALAAGIIAGYFSIAVGITIIACAFFASILGALYAVYYSIRF